MKDIHRKFEVLKGDIVTTDHSDYKNAVVSFDGAKSRGVVILMNEKNQTSYFYINELKTVKRPD